MPIIYEPRGMAREYSPYACNLYIGCSHQCRYCYAPHALQRPPGRYFGVPSPRKNLLRDLEQDLQSRRYRKQILLSFIGDVYCDATDDNQITRDALTLLHEYGAPAAVLSKGGEAMLRDLDLFQEFGNRILVGATLTFFDQDKSMEWEPGAASPAQRLFALRELHQSGVPTFASFEPVIDPAQSLQLIRQTLEDDSVDHYKIGKLNNYRGLDRGVDWQGFLRDALSLLRPAKKQIYIKRCLREMAPRVPLLDDEVDPERYLARA